MRYFPPSHVRNVALIGHAGVGKTTLVESMAAATGATPRPGRVEDRSTISDFEPEEHARGCSLWASLVTLEHDGFKVNVFDTPGSTDFAHEAEQVLPGCEAALLCVSGPDGIQVGTEIFADVAAQAGVALGVVVTKADKTLPDLPALARALKPLVGREVIPVGWAESEGGSYKGARSYLAPEAIPPEELVEAVVSTDEEALERYLEGQRFDVSATKDLLSRAVAANGAAPLLPLSCTLPDDARVLLSLVVDLLPPASSSRATTSEQVHALRVLKVTSDQYSGRIVVCKVIGEDLSPGVTLVNRRTGAEEKVGSLHSLKGKEHLPLDKACRGDLIVLIKAGPAAHGDLIADKAATIDLPDPPPIAAGIAQVAIVPREARDDDKLMSALARLAEEDPALSVIRVDETHQTILRGNGDTHLHVVLERLKRRFGVGVEVVPVMIRYRETISREATAEGKYKKQTGGHGQYGVAVLVISPLERGRGFEFVDEIVGGAIPRQYVPAVEKGVLEAMAQGVVWGYPVTDVKVRCIDGKHHPVDSSELSFKMAGAIAFREAFKQAGPQLLEPISKVTLIVPASVQGDVLGDLNGRRARVLSTEPLSSSYVRIVAHVPEAEMTDYAAALKALTNARGRASVEFDHYDVLPSHLESKVPRKHEKEAD